MAYSRIMDTKGSKMIDGDYTTEARLSQHRKDVQLMLNAAADTDLSLPLSATHLSLLDDAIRLGWGDADNSAVMEVFRRDAGSE
jgi:2-hydroxy-3-oxopropionate reductase